VLAREACRTSPVCCPHFTLRSTSPSTPSCMLIRKGLLRLVIDTRRRGTSGKLSNPRCRGYWTRYVVLAALSKLVCYRVYVQVPSYIPA
jgi:hypothetical protein